MKLLRVLAAFAFGLLIVTGAFLIVVLAMAMRERPRVKRATLRQRLHRGYELARAYRRGA